MNTPHEYWKTFGSAVVNALALITSFQMQVEWVLRCTSLLVGAIAAALGIISWVRKNRKS